MSWRAVSGLQKRIIDHRLSPDVDCFMRVVRIAIVSNLPRGPQDNCFWKRGWIISAFFTLGPRDYQHLPDD